MSAAEAYVSHISTESLIQKLFAFVKANAFVTLLTLSSSVGLWYFLQRDVRAIDVLQNADVRIVTIDSALGSGVQVLLGGQQVSALRALDIEVRNSGNRPILREDYDLPLALVFQGRIAGEVALLSSTPSSLPVRVAPQDDSVVTVSPLLLNPEDAFTIRVLLADNARDDARPVVTGRIVGVSRLGPVLLSAKEQERAAAFLQISIIALLYIVAIVGIVYLVRRGVAVRTGIHALDEFIALYERVALGQKARFESQRLRNELGISNHDVKSNVLLLRLKIEDLLRTLARRHNLQERAIYRMAEELSSKGAIDADLAGLIMGISRVMNRELHTIESFIEPAQFSSLQDSALSVVAGLESALQRAPTPTLASG